MFVHSVLSWLAATLVPGCYCSGKRHILDLLNFGGRWQNCVLTHGVEASWPLFATVNRVNSKVATLCTLRCLLLLIMKVFYIYAGHEFTSYNLKTLQQNKCTWLRLVSYVVHRGDPIAIYSLFQPQSFISCNSLEELMKILQSSVYWDVSKLWQNMNTN